MFSYEAYIVVSVYCIVAVARERDHRGLPLWSV